MKQLFLLLLLSLSLSAIAQTKAYYDKNGKLVTTEEQIQQDQEAGIIKRGGYNPQIAEQAALERLQNVKNAPKIGNSDAPAPGSSSARNVYRCKKGTTEVYADDENKHKFSQCILVRRGTANQRQTRNSNNQSPPVVADPALLPQSQHIVPRTTPSNNAMNPVELAPAVATPATCSGAVLYKGNTYIFNENEPCPIPDSVFSTRRPIEADQINYNQ